MIGRLATTASKAIARAESAVQRRVDRPLAEALRNTPLGQARKPESVWLRPGETLASDVEPTSTDDDLVRFRSLFPNTSDEIVGLRQEDEGVRAMSFSGDDQLFEGADLNEAEAIMDTRSVGPPRSGDESVAPSEDIRPPVGRDEPVEQRDVTELRRSVGHTAGRTAAGIGTYEVTSRGYEEADERTDRDLPGNPLR